MSYNDMKDESLIDTLTIAGVFIHKVVVFMRSFCYDAHWWSRVEGQTPTATICTKAELLLVSYFSH